MAPVTAREIAPRLSRRAAAVGLAVGVPASAVFLVLALRGLDAGELRRTLADADVALLAPAVAVILLVYVFQAQRWRVVARRETDLGFRAALAYVVGAVAVNNVVPGRPGEPLRGFWLARARRIPVARSVATVLVDRTADVLALVTLFAVTVPFVDRPRWVLRLLLAAVVLGALLALALAAAWWYANHSRRGRARAAIPVGERSLLGRHVSGLVRGAAGALRVGDLAAIAAFSLLAWTAWGTSAWLVARAVGIELSPLETAFTTSLVNLGVAIPSSPGFIGTYQWLSVSVLGLFAVGRTDAFAFSILMHAIWFVPTTLAGVGLGLAVAAGRRPAVFDAAPAPRRAPRRP